MDRRSFVVGAGSAILTNRFYRDVLSYADRKGTPLMIAPDAYSSVLYALQNEAAGFDMYLGKHPRDDRPPSWTVRQLARARGHEEPEYVSYLMKHHLMTEEDAQLHLDCEVDQSEVVEYWARRNSANARAFHELQQLNLGPLAGNPGGLGEIRFVDGDSPGNDCRFVTAQGIASLSLLQARLIELNAGILVKPTTWSDGNAASSSRSS